MACAHLFGLRLESIKVHHRHRRRAGRSAHSWGWRIEGERRDGQGELHTGSTQPHTDTVSSSHRTAESGTSERCSFSPMHQQGAQDAGPEGEDRTAIIRQKKQCSSSDADHTADLHKLGRATLRPDLCSRHPLQLYDPPVWYRQVSKLRPGWLTLIPSKAQIKVKPPWYQTIKVKARSQQCVPVPVWLSHVRIPVRYRYR